jgi:hypothetical protein
MGTSFGYGPAADEREMMFLFGFVLDPIGGPR